MNMNTNKTYIQFNNFKNLYNLILITTILYICFEAYEQVIYYFNIDKSPNMAQILILHDKIFFYLILIFVLISWFLFFTLVIFRVKQNIVPWTFLYPTQIEIIWTVVPIIILTAIIIPSFNLLYAQDESINPSYIIKAVGFQWYWNYEFEFDLNLSQYYSLEKEYAWINNSDFANPPVISNNNSLLTIKDDIKTLGYDVPVVVARPYTVINDLLNFYIDPWDYITVDSLLDQKAPHFLKLLDTTFILDLPIHEYVRIIVTSNDVIHSWAIPALGIKVDAVPGRLNQVTTYINESGLFFGQCSEICGSHHGFMPIVLRSRELLHIV